MNKKMREIAKKIQEMTAEAKSFMDGESKDVEKANAIMDEVDALRKEYDSEERLYNMEKANGAMSANEPIADNATPENKDVKESDVTKFAKAVRDYMTGKAMNETTGSAGGYTVPEDISTMINHFREAECDLTAEIAVENVTTNKGARTYQVKGKADKFVDIDENGAIEGELTAPTYKRVAYTIKDRAGFMPVSNDLLHDSDANIASEVSAWIAKSGVATDNAKILATVATKEQVDFKDLKGVKKALNVTLGQAYKDGAKIYTNDDGLNYLDTLEDKNGRPLLNPDPTAPASMTLRVGTTVCPIVVIPNEVLATDDANKVPFIVGSLKDFVKKFDRNQITIDASTTATLGSFNAFAKNMTLMRAIVRNDFEKLDEGSIVYGYITVGE